MWERVKAFFRPRAYHIKFEYVYYGRRYKGTTAWYDSKAAVRRQTEVLNRVYGAGTHWIEDNRGNKL
jgi:hypothetical protein